MHISALEPCPTVGPNVGRITRSNFQLLTVDMLNMQKLTPIERSHGRGSRGRSGREDDGCRTQISVVVGALGSRT